MKSMLATKGMDLVKPTVTFNKSAQTVLVTGGPISTLTDDYKEVADPIASRGDDVAGRDTASPTNAMSSYAATSTTWPTSLEPLTPVSRPPRRSTSAGVPS